MSDLRTIAVPNAPKAIGPYAQGIAAGGFLFTAGQTPLDPATMKLVDGRRRRPDGARLRQPRSHPRGRRR